MTGTNVPRKPEPSRDQVWSSTRRSQRNGSDGGKHNKGGGDLPCRNTRGGKRIVNSEAAGPDRQEKVLAVRDKRVRQAQRKRRVDKSSHRSSVRLREVGYDHGGRDQAEERKLFTN